MKYLKNFRHFENIEVNVTDEPDQKLAKENTNDFEKYLKDFPMVKSELDRAFNEIKSDKDNEALNKKIEDIKSKFPGNPFITEYTRMMNLQIRLKSTQDQIAKYNDDLFKNEEDLKELVSSKSDTTAKLKTIEGIKNNQKLKNQEIIDLKKDLTTAEKDLKSKTEEIKKKMLDSSKIINSI